MTVPDQIHSLQICSSKLWLIFLLSLCYLYFEEVVRFFKKLRSYQLFYFLYFLGGFLKEISFYLKFINTLFCCCSFIQACPTLCNTMDCSTPGFPILHHLPQFAQIHVHRAGDAIQPSHPLSSPSPPVFNLSQHQSFPMSQFFPSGGFQSIGV